jgi:hypothetical protein
MPKAGRSRDLDMIGKPDKHCSTVVLNRLTARENSSTVELMEAEVR